MTQSNELGSADPGPATEQAAQQPEQHLCRERHTERASHDYVQNAAQWAHVAKLPSTEPSFIDIRRLDVKPMLETPTWSGQVKGRGERKTVFGLESVNAVAGSYRRNEHRFDRAEA
ncbi:hypothetical protein AXG93_399s1140 [Marchantia polymorpha subsp. ruderalis]|uniref:Uncharacterized protein n=1 Tax=Marchantia polymorpha subsp. ruderalis TaxID=1480154 RepID=A0A176WKM2_MARPO|nr:hypothetical protein AXG93_399s1140 [Marchantia polymorpha subsp. ruderalis]